MTVIEERLSVLDTLVLEAGGHESPEDGMCVMEAVAYIAGEPFSDHPQCASAVVTSFLVSWNDSLPDADRQMLKPLIPRVVGTRTTKEDEEVRAWMATDWLVRECAPAFLRLAGLTEHAEKLEQLAALTGSREAKAAQPALDEARKAAAAAGDAARDAAWAATREAAWAAARAAAWAAAGAAARAAAGAAAWAAAGAAARDAAWAAARDAAWAAAWAAAGDAAWAATREAAWDAAWAAAEQAKAEGGGYTEQYEAAYKAASELFAKQPPFPDTIKALQQSAYLLVERMIEVGREEKAA